jgi:hypothetical protein
VEIWNAGMLGLHARWRAFTSRLIVAFSARSLIRFSMYSPKLDNTAYEGFIRF